MSRKAFFIVLLVSLFGPAAATEIYPARPVRLIAPFSPGGGVDIVARSLAQKLAEKWGQQVVVDNRTGATGIIGTDLATHALPDGYTLLLGNAATHAVNVSLFKKLPYDAVKDFAPITLIGRVPEMLVVHPALPAATVKELIGLAKAKPLTFGSAGAGSPPHLAGELFQYLAKVKLVHVPYKGSAPALTDLLGGQINMYFREYSVRRAAGEIGALARSRRHGPEKVCGRARNSDHRGSRSARLRGLQLVWHPCAQEHAQIDRGEAACGHRRDRQKPGNDGPAHAQWRGSHREYARRIRTRFIREEIGRYALVIKAAGLRAE